jgi:hypothetical protein
MLLQFLSFYHLGAANGVESAGDPVLATCPDMVLKLLPRDLLAAAITGQWELGADLIVCLQVRMATGCPAVPAVQAPLRALLLSMALLLAEADQAFTCGALGQQEWAESFVAALVFFQGPLPSAPIIGADSRQALHLPAGGIIWEGRTAF